MAATIGNIQIQQVEPFPEPGGTTQVLATFDIFGPPPDVVEIYVGIPGTPMETLADTIEITPSDLHGSVLLELRAGIIYTLSFCPRNLTDGVLDDRIEGAYWESFCTGAIQFTTRAGEPDFPTPVFDSIKPQPKSFTRPN